MDILFQIFENIVLLSGPFCVFYGMGTGKNTGKLSFRTIGQTGSNGLSITEGTNSIVISTTASGVSAIQTCQIAYGTTLNNNITSNYFCGITTNGIKAIVGSDFFSPIGLSSPTGIYGTNLILSGAKHCNDTTSNCNVIISGCCNSTISNSNKNTIIGGLINTIDQSSNCSSIINSILSSSTSTTKSTLLNSHTSCIYSSSYSSIISSCGNARIRNAQYSTIIGSYYNTCITPLLGSANIVGSSIIASCCSSIYTQYGKDPTYNSLILTSKLSNIFGGVYGFYDSSDSPKYSSVLSSYQSSVINSKYSSVLSSKGSTIHSNQYYKYTGYYNELKNSSILSSCNSVIQSVSVFGQNSNIDTQRNTIIGSKGSVIEQREDNFLKDVNNSTIISSCEFYICGSVGISSISNKIGCTSDASYSSAISGTDPRITCSIGASIISGNKARIYGKDTSKYGCFNSIISGSNIICTSVYTSIISGSDNLINTGSRGYSAILSSNSSKIYNRASVIIGSQDSEICSQYNTIIGTYMSVQVSSYYSTITSSCNSCICDGTLNSIFGGLCNKIYNTSTRSTIIGGAYNCINGGYASVIIGGESLANPYSNTAMFQCLVLNGTSVNGNFGRQGRICINTVPAGGIKIRKGLVTLT